MKKKKILAVQPHSDDVLFCCSHILFSPEEYNVTVLTVENDEKRIKEDTKLYEFLEIPFHHLDVEFKDDSFYGFHKKYKDMDEVSVYEHLDEYFGKEKLKEIKKSLLNFVKKFLSKNKVDTILVPWGVGHPFHFFIRDVITNNVDCKIQYYRDFPHSYKRRAISQVQKQKQDYSLNRSVEVEEFHDVKWKLASKFYRTQSGLQFFEQGYIKKQLPEEIYEFER